MLLLNSDAWLDEGALDALVAFADAHPEPPSSGRACAIPTGSLQRSVRGFPTLWRLATEYLYLRKLAPGSRALNAFYGAGFAHDETREAEFLMGAVWLVRRAAIDEVGPADESFFLFSEEVDWAYRFRRGRLDVRVLPRRRRDARVRRLAPGAALHREPARAPAVPRASTAALPTPSGRASPAALLAPPPRRADPRRARPHVPRGGRLARLRHPSPT